MLKYKLTNQDNTTYNNTKWGQGITHETSGEGELCSSGWLHYYHSPELAVLLNPIHANILNPKLWEVEAEGMHKDDKGLKGGCTKMTTIKEIPLPEFSLEQKVKFGILCALQVYKEENFVNWANNWLNGTDRSSASANVAAANINAYAANAAANAAAAAHAAVNAVNAAVNAANGDNAAYAAANAAANADDEFDLQSICKKAMSESC